MQTTNFLPLIELCKPLGVTYLEDMNIGRNVGKYSSTCRDNITRHRQVTASFPILFSLH